MSNLIDREKKDKIEQLICNIRTMYGSFEQVVDYAIKHGMTVRERQKPLTLLEATSVDYCWIEAAGIGLRPCSCVIAPNGWSVEVQGVGGNPYWLAPQKYGYAWRCWAERPTDEERIKAEWEEDDNE